MLTVVEIVIIYVMDS